MSHQAVAVTTSRDEMYPAFHSSCEAADSVLEQPHGRGGGLGLEQPCGPGVGQEGTWRGSEAGGGPGLEGVWPWAWSSLVGLEQHGGGLGLKRV